MTEATAGHVVDLLEASAEGREHYARAADVADELGIRGILTRMVGSRMPPVSEGERVYALLWDETLLEARADVEEDSVWGQTLLPVSPPLVVPARGQVRASVRPEPLPDGAPGWLSWAVESGAEARNGHEFAAELSSLEDLYGDILGIKAAETLPSRESCHDRSEP